MIRPDVILISCLDWSPEHGMEYGEVNNPLDFWVYQGDSYIIHPETGNQVHHHMFQVRGDAYGHSILGKDIRLFFQSITKTPVSDEYIESYFGDAFPGAIIKRPNIYNYGLFEVIAVIPGEWIRNA